MRLTSLHQVSAEELELGWDDGLRMKIPVRLIRDHCPCAGCAGETVLFKSYAPPPADTSVPGRYRLTGVEPVGGYALKFTWGDGHDLGLYTWDRLRDLARIAGREDGGHH